MSANSWTKYHIGREAIYKSLEKLKLRPTKKKKTQQRIDTQDAKSSSILFVSKSSGHHHIVNNP